VLYAFFFVTVNVLLLKENEIKATILRQNCKMLFM